MSKVFILVGPSGVGKTTLARTAAIDCPNLRWVQTDTTRQPRLDEVGGLTGESGHRFVPHSKINTDTHICIRRAGEEYYGLDVDHFNAFETWNIVVVLDEAGAQELRERVKGCVVIGIGAPSVKELWKRLEARKSPHYCSDICPKGFLNYLIVNDDPEMTAGMLAHIIQEETKG